MFVDRLVNGLKADLGGFWGHVAPPQLPPQGLHTFRVTPPGGTVRLHLRVEAIDRDHRQACASCVRHAATL